jgi:hypothetical protein
MNTRRVPRLGLLAGVGLLAVTAAGCGGRGDRLPVYRAGGAVTVGGRPAAGVLVLLHPADGTPAAAARVIPSATTGGDGAFQLTSFDQGDGAPAGDYAVTLAWYQGDPRAGSGKRRPAVGGIKPDRFKGTFSDPKRPAWRVTIVNGDNALGSFAVK